MPKKPASKERPNPFAGKTFVITGEMEKYSQFDAQIHIEVRGGQVKPSPSKTTDYLLAGDKPGAKLVKAKALGLTVLNEADFDRMVKQAGPVTPEQQKAYMDR